MLSVLRMCATTIVAAITLPTLALDWQLPPDKITVLVVIAHPDDEGIFFGGALPYYSSILQVPTMLVAMTSGGSDQNGVYLRENELRNAAWTYGLRYEPIFGRFRDIPSHDTNVYPYPLNPYTNTIDLTWDLWADGVAQRNGSDVEAGKLRAANFIAEQIRRYKPEIVITHDLNGEYGHDNHKAASRAATNAFFIAGDPTATGTNLAGLPPWQAKKLYLHLYPTNRIFHRYWEIPVDFLNNRSARQIADAGLAYHVSQGGATRVATSVYRSGELYDAYPSEWWGLYASTVGPDPVLPHSTNIFGYVITNGVAAGNFLLNVMFPNNWTNRPPTFVSPQFSLKPAKPRTIYLGQTLVNQETDADLPWGDATTFTKLSGPAWLTVAPDGTLGGTPSTEDVGLNEFLIRVTDSGGLYDEAILVIDVLLHGLVSWWKLDETGGSSVSDGVPPEYQGTASGGVAFNQPGATPYSGKSVQFDGLSGKVDVPFAQDLNLPTFTVALWAKVVGGAGMYRAPLSNRRTGPTGGYVFYAGPNNRWQLWAGNGSAWNTLDGGPAALNQWVHLAATYDGTNLSFYRDGALVGSTPIAMVPSSSLPLRMGAGANEGPAQYWFPGQVDDVRVFREALDVASVASLYSNRPPAFSSSPLRLASAVVGAAYTGQDLSRSAYDPDSNEILTFSKLIGPAWLKVSPNGALSGQPGSADAGLNTFVAHVEDGHLAAANATLEINVLSILDLPLISDWSVNSGALRIGGLGIPGRAYLLEATTNLAGNAEWTPIATNSAATDARFEFDTVETSGWFQRFFRVRAAE